LRLHRRPAHLSKNIAWWLFAIPSFIAGGLTLLVHSTIQPLKTHRLVAAHQ
jgi:hypothetical protein